MNTLTQDRNKEIFQRECGSNYGEYCKLVKEINRIVNELRVDNPKGDADLVFALVDTIIDVYSKREAFCVANKDYEREERYKVLQYVRKWQTPTGYVSDSVVGRKFKK